MQYRPEPPPKRWLRYTPRQDGRSLPTDGSHHRPSAVRRLTIRTVAGELEPDRWVELLGLLHRVHEPITLEVAATSTRVHAAVLASGDERRTPEPDPS